MLNSVSSASFLQVHLLVEITPHLEPKLKESLGNVILSPLPLLHTRHIPRGLRQKSSNPFNCWPVFSTDSWFTQLLVLFLIYLSQSRYFLNLFFHFTVWISALNSKIFLRPTINIFLGLLLFLLHGMLVLIVFCFFFALSSWNCYIPIDFQKYCATVNMTSQQLVNSVLVLENPSAGAKVVFWNLDRKLIKSRIICLFLRP